MLKTKKKADERNPSKEMGDALCSQTGTQPGKAISSQEEIRPLSCKTTDFSHIYTK